MVGQPVTIYVLDRRRRILTPHVRTVRALGAAPVTDDPDEHLAGADVHDLDDAPGAPTGGLAALTEAFPGAELLEEP